MHAQSTPLLEGPKKKYETKKNKKNSAFIMITSHKMHLPPLSKDLQVRYCRRNPAFPPLPAKKKDKQPLITAVR